MPPNPLALKRQRDGKEWTHLPAAGRLAPAPEWPDEVHAPTENELLLWRRVWMLPQALVWEADKAHDLVAFYCRTYVEAMHPRAGAQGRTFVRQLSNDLYLAPAALAQGRYIIDDDPDAKAMEAAMREHPAGGAPGRARDRLNVVPMFEPEDEDEPQPESDKDDRPPF